MKVKFSRELARMNANFAKNQERKPKVYRAEGSGQGEKTEELLCN